MHSMGDGRPTRKYIIVDGQKVDKAGKIKDSLPRRWSKETEN